MKDLFKTTKEDFFSSISLLLISLPMSAGIAVASNAPPEAGILAAIFGSLLMGLFSSSSLVIYGPAVGLSVFVSGAVVDFNGLANVAPAVILSGVWLLVLSFLRADRLANIIPTSVMKGMTAGIGLILVLKMLPHLFGLDEVSFINEVFIHAGLNVSFENVLPGALLISGLSFILMLFPFPKKVPSTILVVAVGILLNEGLKLIKPEWALVGEHALTVDSKTLAFHFPDISHGNWVGILQTSFVFTAVILLEGMVSLDIFQKFDPKHSVIKIKRELLCMGFVNILMGFLGILPIMPVIIRSKANLQFGAKHRSAVLLLGVWLVMAFTFSNILSKIPIASIAVVLLIIGFNLVDIPHLRGMMKKGLRGSLPYFVTLILILLTNLIWGIFAGLMVGILLAVWSLVHRSMVLVQDERSYLLKFYKDVNFFNKNELHEALESIPPGGEIAIDGTGNIAIDEEIENFLIEFASESQERGVKVTFVKSRLSVSKLFKE